MDRVDITQYKDIWVFAEQRQGKITPVVIELLGEGRKLADVKGIKLNAILLGKDVENLAQELIS
ncbi:MAG: electron transfer flavoprotein subunit alpha, partial [Peptostreptococcus sp.]|nr:electron transfer flavoprotein subunit alpha [Peptostreptococcus sp.]